MKYQYEESEMPYSILDRFGLTQEMVEDLPIDVLKSIYEGQTSPVLPVQVTMDDGEVMKTRTRFSLFRKQDGSVDIMFYPVLDEFDIKSFNESQQEKLLANKTIIEYKDKNNTEKKIKCFMQLDKEINQVLSVPTPVIGHNLQIIADNFKLIASEIKSLQNGEVLTIISNNQQVSLGIDLHSRSGIRFAAGNEEQWERESKREWEKYTFGAFGCWVMDEDGNLDYVRDEDYTEEMWNEQKKHGMRLQHQR